LTQCKSPAYFALFFFGYISGLLDELDLDTQTAIFKIWYLCRLIVFSIQLKKSTALVN